MLGSTSVDPSKSSLARAVWAHSANQSAQACRLLRGSGVRQGPKFDLLEGVNFLHGPRDWSRQSAVAPGLNRRARRHWGWLEAVTAYLILIGTGVPTIWFLRAAVGTPQPFTALLPGSMSTYALSSAALVGFLWIGVMGRSPAAIPEVFIVPILLVVTVCLVAWYGYFVPTWAPGSDNADALSRGAVQILRREDPYSVTSKFGGPLSPMLGGFLLAMPFVVFFGGMYLYGLAWFVGGVCALYGSVGARAAVAAVSLFAFSAWSRMALPSQSDNWITAAGVVAAGSLGHWALAKSGRATGWLAVSAVL